MGRGPEGAAAVPRAGRVAAKSHGRGTVRPSPLRSAAPNKSARGKGVLGQLNQLGQARRCWRWRTGGGRPPTHGAEHPVFDPPPRHVRARRGGGAEGAEGDCGSANPIVRADALPPPAARRPRSERRGRPSAFTVGRLAAAGSGSAPRFAAVRTGESSACDWDAPPPPLSTRFRPGRSPRPGQRRRQAFAFRHHGPGRVGPEHRRCRGATRGMFSTPRNVDHDAVQGGARPLRLPTCRRSRRWGARMVTPTRTSNHGP